MPRLLGQARLSVILSLFMPSRNYHHPCRFSLPAELTCQVIPNCVALHKSQKKGKLSCIGSRGSGLGKA